MEKSSFSLQTFGITDIGLSRKKNEDFYLIDEKNSFFALADGMGGHKAGEVAAKNAIETVSSHFLNNKPQTDSSTLTEILYNAIHSANGDIHNLSRSDPKLRGMGTTLCSLYLFENYALFAHVGDSRIYQLRNKQLKKLTHDHSLIQDLIETGHIEEDEPMSSPYKNVITKALGPSPYIEPEIDICSVAPNDLFILCSDGLSDFVSERRMAKILNDFTSLEQKGKKLIELAKQRKSQDNITLIIIQIQ